MQQTKLDRGSRILVTGGSGFIGTNLMAALCRDGVEAVNLDSAVPLCRDQLRFWQPCDVLDRATLIDALHGFAPTHVVHLAARTDCDERRSLTGYQQNTEGTANVLDAVHATGSVRRLIVTSTQFVCRPGHVPQHDEDYAPHTIYGQSKVVTEQLTRRARLVCAWTIVRPTTIWGPWLMRHRDQLFPLLRRGWYVHPGRERCIRSWGYVGNVVHQLLRILEMPRSEVHTGTFYLGDPPGDLVEWIDACSRHLRGSNVRIAPRFLVRLIALVGDAAALCGGRFPITSSRFRSMTEDYWTPTERTLELLGPSPYSLEAGMAEVVRWLRVAPTKEHKIGRSTRVGMTALECVREIDRTVAP